MNSYKAISKQVFTLGNYSIVPIRFEDRFEILKWRNEQIYHLRQKLPLTLEDQNNYFNDVIATLFDQNQPNQILFSYLEGDKCIGYGGLVHINWEDKNSEISFIMNTELEENYFSENWSVYLKLLEKVGFVELNLHKLYVYAFDLRPHLYTVLEENYYFLDARLKEHCHFQGAYKDVVIYSKVSE